MKLYTSYLTKNDCYKQAKKIVPKGIMVHSTASNNPKISRYVQSDDPEKQNIIGLNKYGNDWNRPNVKKCVHAFIGKLADGSVGTVKTLPLDYKGWHAGTGTSGKSANNTHISFEICEDGLNDYSYFKATVKEASEFVAYLCSTFGFNPTDDNVIICHKDGYKLGIASNHADVYHWWKRFNYTMNDFREDVVKVMTSFPNDVEEEKEDMVYYKTLYDVPSYYRDSVKKVIDKKGLIGNEKGEINVSEDMCRIYVSLDRMNVL